RVIAGQQSKVDGVLRPEFYEMEEYEVTAEEFQEQAVQLLQERQQGSSLLDSIGSEKFSRAGATDATDIVSKLPGITISESKNPIVRGLNERYVGMQLNGADVPSPDPYRKSAPLDLFPANVIDRIVVNKSFTPDMPGNFTGGGVNIVTKSFPEKFFANVTAGASSNTQATGNDQFLTYDGGSTDWFGMDDGTRSIVDELSSPELTVPAPPFTTGLPTSPNYQRVIAEATRLQELTTAMGLTQFAPSRKAPPFNHSFGASVGDTQTLLGRPFGYFAGATYGRTFSFYESGISRRYVPGVAPGRFTARKDYSDTKASEDVNWSTVVNLAYKPSDLHEFNFNFLYNQNSEDLARLQQGTTTDDPGTQFSLNRLHFTERNLHTFQLRGGHEFPTLARARFDWLGAMSFTSQEEPDARFFNFANEGGNFVLGKASAPDPKNPTRYFRKLDEDNRNVKLDLTIPFKQWSDREGKIKFGFFRSISERQFIDREVFYQGNAPFDGDPNTYLTPEVLGYTATTNATNRRITYSWDRYIQTRDSDYTGLNDITAGYAMFELPLMERLQLLAGFRYETTSLGITSRSYLANSLTGRPDNSSSLEAGHILPAANLAYTIRTNMNLRLSYSQTIARPSFRELAGYRSYDPTLDELLDGNPNLKMSEIDNYDIRWEWFPRPGEVLAVSLFYKDLINAIERRYITIDGEIITFDNRATAQVYGIELEAQKNLGFISDHLSDFSIGANVALIQSEVPLTPTELNARDAALGTGETTRPLYDQSPYIINVDFNYDNPRLGTSATVVYNIFGPRITIAGLNTDDVYEQPISSLDFVLSQKIWDRLKMKFTAKNLFDPLIERSYGKEGELLYSSYRRGRTFGLSLSYDF
ncbi:MAG: TonB-dependent receptor, partial [Verrucomicrobiales bacterium]|nr:TonB-dependent receptor [Verrucomicrobiales bacterium]